MPTKKIIIEETRKIKPKKTAVPRKKKATKASEKEEASLDLRHGPAPLKIGAEELRSVADTAPEIMEKEPEKDKKVNVQISGGSFMEKLKRAGVEEKSVEETAVVQSVIPEARTPMSPSKLRLYKRIAGSFIVLTLILIAAVFYFVLVKTTIILIPNQERSANNLILEVYDASNGQEPSGSMVSGKIDEITVTEEKKFPATGSEVLGEKLNGQVVIYNNYIKNQPLVATTRLLAPDGKMFRIKDTVNVPAGGSVAVEIYADDPSTNMEIGPTKFTLPGLWSGIQDKIYAEAKSGLKKEQQIKRVINQSDIDNGIKELKADLMAKAKDEIGQKYSAYNQVIYNVDDSTILTETDGQAGDEKDEITIKIKAKVAITAFNEDAILKLAAEKLSSTLPPNKELKEISPKNITYSVSDFDFNQKKSSLNVTFEGVMILKNDANIVDRKALVGLSKPELEAYLNNLSDIAGYEINFSPSFIKRTPYLVDRIKIEVKK